MKKWIVIECIILAVVLVGAAAIFVALPYMTGPKLTAVPAPQLTARTETVAPLEQKLGATWKVFDDRTLSAHSAFVYDCEEEEYLHLTGKPAQQVYPPSITKLFTTWVMLQILQPDQKITAGDALQLVRSNSSVAGIKKGDTLTAQQLIQGMLLPSGNDAACILAVEAGRTLAGDESLSCEAAVARFMEEVNARAKKEGLTGTHFVTPDGYHDPDHYTTLEDMLKIGQLAMSNETIAKYAAVAQIETGLKDVPVWHNTNWLVRPDSEYYCPYAKGLKTGRTTEAGNCLMSAFTIDGEQYIIGVFGCEKTADRFADTLHLLNGALGVTQ